MSLCSSPSSSSMNCSGRVMPSTFSNAINNEMPEPPRKISKEQAEGTASCFYFATDSTMPVVTAGFNRLDLSSARASGSGQDYGSGSGPGSECSSNSLLNAPKKEKCHNHCSEKPSSARRLFSSPKLTSDIKMNDDKMVVEDVDEGVELDSVPNDDPKVQKKLF